jgi:hypothetical protein
LNHICLCLHIYIYVYIYIIRVGALKFAGANVILRASQQINHLSVWYLEKEMFTCKITELHHGGDGELDRLCYDAALAFARQARRVLLHVRHKYKFDKEKSNLFKKCPCQPDGTPNPLFMDSNDEDEEDEEEDNDEDNEEEDSSENKRRPGTSEVEVYGEDEFGYPDFPEEEGESDKPPTKHISRIYFKPLGNRILMHPKVKPMIRRIVNPHPSSHHKKLMHHDEFDEEEFVGEYGHAIRVDDGPLNFNHKIDTHVVRPDKETRDFSRAYDRLRVGP